MKGSAVMELLADYGTERVKAKLLEFPGMIRTQKAAVRECRECAEDARGEVKLVEGDLMVEVSGAVNPDTGKPMYGNDKAREAALLKAKSESAVYKAAQARARIFEHDLAGAEDELGALYDEFRAYRYVARLTAEELALMASENEAEEGQIEFAEAVGVGAGGNNGNGSKQAY